MVINFGKDEKDQAAYKIACDCIFNNICSLYCFCAADTGCLYALDKNVLPL